MFLTLCIYWPWDVTDELLLPQQFRYSWKHSKYLRRKENLVNSLSFIQNESNPLFWENKVGIFLFQFCCRFLFSFLFLAVPFGLWDLSSMNWLNPEIEPWEQKCRVLTTGLPGDSLIVDCLELMNNSSYFIIYRAL